MYRQLDNVLRSGSVIIEVRSQEDFYSLMDELYERGYCTVAHANGFPAHVGIMDQSRVFIISHGLRTAPDMVWR